SRECDCCHRFRELPNGHSLPATGPASTGSTSAAPHLSWSCERYAQDKVWQPIQGSDRGVNFVRQRHLELDWASARVISLCFAKAETAVCVQHDRAECGVRGVNSWRKTILLNVPGRVSTP